MFSFTRDSRSMIQRHTQTESEESEKGELQMEIKNKYGSVAILGTR